MTAPSGFLVSALWPHLLALYGVTLLPLAVGLPPIVAIVESVYVMTGREIWKQIARFWGRLLGVVLLMWAIGSIVLTLLYVADANRFTRYIHGTPGPALIMFFLPFVFAFGLLLWNWFRDWWSLGRVKHLLVTWLWVPLSGLAVLKFAIGFGLLDSPAGVDLDAGSLQVWIYDVPAVLLNPAAQSRFVHLMAACYLVAATLVLSLSAWYLLNRRNVQIARRSLTVAASFGLAAALSLAVLGDHRGYAASSGQQMRIAAIAAEWHTQKQPAPFTVFGIPDMQNRTTHAALNIPWVLGLGATHSWRKSVPGLDELEAVNVARIHDGVAAFTVMDTPWANPAGAGDLAFDLEDTPNLGYGMLLLRRAARPAHATDAQIAAAARDTIPNVPLLFWTFRIMALLGVYGIALFGCAFWFASKRRLDRNWFLRMAAWSLPVPWIAGALGWIVSEAGRGPWLVDGILPVTEMHLGRPELIIAVIGVTAIAVLVVMGTVLITRLVRIGPEGLKLWPVDPGLKRTW
ncbi:MAG: Cytochrome d ubiquinol oxidase subunit I [Rhodanobacteraceae bacterium]|jgi:cytochrome d ubiquinol oxidase subunit I|nr:MAG: Cytochrome d ubiquinol oxidase subunit I [Rhodanobacteraceae bacterium]